MPKRAKELGPLDVKRAAHPGGFDRHHWIDVGQVAGLRLQVTAGGTKSWLLRTMVGAKRRTFGLGAYPEVSLAKAREKAREMKRKIAGGVDPSEEKKTTRAALAAAAARSLAFAVVMER